MVRLLGLLVLVSSQNPKKVPAQAHPRVDQVRVDAAIQRGVEYLKGLPDYGVKKSRRDELVLLTYVHAGLPETDPKFQELFKRMTETPLERTYNVALQAMILEELDRLKYQHRIAQCAQFLVDNLCRNGQWSYGRPTIFVNDIPTGAPLPKAVATGKGRARDYDPSLPPGQRQKPKVVRKIPIRKMREADREKGDNSNSQYAALGLRACHDAGIVFAREVIELARKWWYESQHESDDPKAGYPPRGWSYQEKGDFHPYGSMTAGAVGGLVIFDHILGEKWQGDKAVQAGMEWMARRFTVTENPGPPEKHGSGLNHYYYLYAVERLGVLHGATKFGGHEWYPDGATYLLGAQKPDGSWESDDEICDTCYAILFLRRATRPLVDIASVDRLRK